MRYERNTVAIVGDSGRIVGRADSQMDAAAIVAELERLRTRCESLNAIVERYHALEVTIKANESTLRKRAERAERDFAMAVQAASAGLMPCDRPMCQRTTLELAAPELAEAAELALKDMYWADNPNGVDALKAALAKTGRA